MIISQFTRASVQHPDHSDDVVMVSNEPGCAPVFAVIDGMGGQQHQLEDGTLVTGCDAAQTIRDTFTNLLRSLPVGVTAGPGSVAEQSAQSAFQLAHRLIYQSINDGEKLPQKQRVGAVATLVMVCENGKRLLVTHVGDTRAYLFSHGVLNQLVTDEDNLEHKVRQNLLSADDADRITQIIDQYDGMNDPNPEGTVYFRGESHEISKVWRWFAQGNRAMDILPPNIVISALGLAPFDPIPQISRRAISRGDMLLLCSDGLYKNLTTKEIIATLQDADDPALELGEAAFARSKDKTNQRATADDISIIVVEF